MKLLLDENLPKRLKADYPNHEVYTVRDMNWNGKKNGELMQLMLENSFDALITFDKNLQYQLTSLNSVCPFSQESELECSLARHAKPTKSAVCWCT